MKPPIPPAHSALFENGIRHPDLYLWDAWSYHQDGAFHLYCLAVSRSRPDGGVLQPAERNDYPFHVRHFSSIDEGKNWKDEGCFQTPGQARSGHDARNVWSGSIEPLLHGGKLVAYTGLYEIGAERTFLQNISLAFSGDGYRLDRLQEQPLSCPLRDRQQILNQGYYLDTVENLGHKDGEGGGPIMAWRDPFIFSDRQGLLHLYWSAKSDPCHGVIAHGIIEKTGDGYRLDRLYPPLSLPDGEDFTQAELPKVYCDRDSDSYYLILATCNRQYEGQSDDEVDKRIRIYRSDSLRGPWRACAREGSAIAGLDGLFGMTVLKTDFDRQRLLCIAPYTDAVESDRRLTFAAPFYIDLGSGEVVK